MEWQVQGAGQRLQTAALTRTEIEVTGDAGIALCGAVLGAVAAGESNIYHCPKQSMVQETLQNLQRLGVALECGDEQVTIQGQPYGEFAPKSDLLEFSRYHQGVPMLAGILAGQTFTSKLTWDRSTDPQDSRQQAKQLEEWTKPLKKMGAKIKYRKERLEVGGNHGLKGVHYQIPSVLPAAKAAPLLAGLYAKGDTVVTEPYHTQDHLERALMWFGVPLEAYGNLQNKIQIANAGKQLKGKALRIPGDFSLAAPWLTAAVLLPNRQITIRRVGVNPSRTGLLQVLRQMGADIQLTNLTWYGYEPVADITAASSSLHGVEVRLAQIASLSQELPLLAVAAACAQGVTICRGVDDFRDGSNDRIQGAVEELRKFGISISQSRQTWSLEGGCKPQAATANARQDLSLTAALLVAALLTDGQSSIQNAGEWQQQLQALPDWFIK